MADSSNFKEPERGAVDIAQMNVPDFVIAGAAKAGTTSLHWMLNRHPDICMSPLKETNYFAGMPLDLRGPGDQEHTVRKVVTSQSEYDSLFAGREPGQLTGETSPSYLYFHESAAQRLHEANEAARVILILRDPVERAYSHYLHMVRDLRETLSFREGLEAEEHRRESNWEWAWSYAAAGLYADGVATFIDVFGREAVFVAPFELLRNSPNSLLSELQRFLGVQEISMEQILHANPSGIPRSRTLQRLLVADSPVKTVLKAVLPSSTASRIKHWMFKHNTTRREMPEDVRRELRDYFREDIRRLVSVTGDNRFLSWANPR